MFLLLVSFITQGDTSFLRELIRVIQQMSDYLCQILDIRLDYHTFGRDVQYVFYSRLLVEQFHFLRADIL